MNTPSAHAAAGISAGAATVDITPEGSFFLYGYPHVPRMSTGVHDPLECAALYLKSGDDAALFLASDVFCFTRTFVADVRRRIMGRTGVREEAILISATHTHSGPIMADHLSNAADPVLPKVDPKMLEWMAGRMVESAVAAVGAAVPAEVGVVVTRAAGVGSNRHNPSGPADPEVPVLVARAVASGEPIGCMLVYGMHPTVLHEDSTLISADFPFFTRRFLRRNGLPARCPVIYHNGASGDQSPRHMTHGNTFAEAERLGENLGRCIAAALPALTFRRVAAIRCRSRSIELTPRLFPAEEDALRAVKKAQLRYERLQREGAPSQSMRTAECDVFGAEETAELARADADGRLGAAIAACSPAEIQVIEIGPWTFVAWPGEFFVAYSLALKARVPGTFLITLANGELQGYVVTPEAAARGCYEARNAIFAATSGAQFVDASIALLTSKG